MPQRRRMLAATIAALVALALAACTPASPQRTPTPTAASTPLFSSDAEALKAATDAYAAYLKVTDEVLGDGGANSDRFSAVSSGDALKSARKDAAEFLRNRARTIGETRFDSARLEYYKPREAEPVAIFVCDDVSGVDVVGPDGASLVTPERKTRTPWQVLFVYNHRSRHLTVGRRSLWTGEDFCVR